MTKRRYPAPHERGDIFGQWIGVTALLASTTTALDSKERQRISTRLHVSLEDIARGCSPDVRSWRDLVDCMNFMQSAVEKGWATDEAGAIENAKAALLEACEHARKHDKVRMSATSLESIRTLLEEFDAIVIAISARSYWQLVAHTQQRVQRLLRGAKQRGDVIVSM